MILAIYGSRRQEPYAPQLAVFFDILAQQGVDVVMHKKLYDCLVHLMPASLGAVKKVVTTPDFRADAALSLGGDGTFLRTAMWVADKEIPILGVNTGHLGYLSAADIDELPQVAAELTSGHYQTEARSLLHVVTPELPTWPYALNEVAISKEETSSMINAVTSIDGAHLADYKADALLIATPTGSTAYNLSAGGPIIQPSAPVWVLSPIAAHSLGLRPIVVCDSSEIAVSVDARARDFRLTLDGRAVVLPVGTELTLRRAPFAVHLIKRQGHTFARALREKLHWSE